MGNGWVRAGRGCLSLPDGFFPVLCSLGGSADRRPQTRRGATRHPSAECSAWGPPTEGSTALGRWTQHCSRSVDTPSTALGRWTQHCSRSVDTGEVERRGSDTTSVRRRPVLIEHCRLAACFLLCAAPKPKSAPSPSRARAPHVPPHRPAAPPPGPCPHPGGRPPWALPH